MFNKKQLQAQKEETRKYKSLRHRRPDESISSKELSRLVSKKTGFKIIQTTEIVDALFEIMYESILDKKQLHMPRIGTISGILHRVRTTMNFNRFNDLPAEKMIAQPRFKLEFIQNQKIGNEIKELPVSKEEVNKMYL
jgi:nucleoid DNA-binding protein